MTPSRPALRYYGGKWRIAPWVISHFPTHTCYVEPFAGGASVLLRKAPSKLEVYNDLDGDVVAFFRVLRERPQDLLRAIRLTPYSRQEYEAAFTSEGDDLEQARRLYVRSRQGRGGGCTRKSRNGWRFHRRTTGGDVKSAWGDVAHLEAIADRFRLVQIEHDDARKVLARYDTPETLFYLDPPYVKSTRHETARWEYSFEMTDSDHRQLAAALHEIRGMAIVSGYPCDLYEELYRDWRRVTTRTITDSSSEATECLWLSPSVTHRTHLPLLGGAQ